MTGRSLPKQGVHPVDPVARNQSKHVDEAGVLRYDADNSEVFPGPTGIRVFPTKENA